MYKLYFFLFCAVLCASCTKKYKIEGTSSVSMLDGKMLFIKVPAGDHWENIDSAEVIHGLFKMKGEVDSTVFASLYMDDDCIMPLVIEPGNISIAIDNAGITIKGTPLNDSFNDFIMKKNSLDDKAYDVEHEESRMIMDGHDLETVHNEIGKKRAALADEMNRLAKEFIQQNYDNVLGPGVFLMLFSGMPYPVLTPMMEEIVEKAPESFMNDPLVKEYVAAARSNMEKMNQHP
ncbi:DUF4369 domain-containing protein [uncultured Phocaeicola sp.]|jgi:hypothetical protein|uniref:DUF4369 domain-containing protein n=1 Tax=uncultured Phocaeicola sp. TaxID=990718 RepID=UPI0015B2E203|nr:DUF4369 domain-containing protein [uncultured Phocaeicola sp.]